MKIYYTVSIDVEPDSSFNWHYTNPTSFESVKKGVGEILQPLFNKYNAVPTYMINNIVLEDSESVGVFKNLPGRYELAPHLHPEFIAPDKSITEYGGAAGRALCCAYPEDIERRKLINITELFKSAFGVQPSSFRAGRFAAGRNTLAVLSELGYLVDTSVTPHVSWNYSVNGKQYIDYKNYPEQPYYPEFKTQGVNKKPLLEVPVSTIKGINFSQRNPFKPTWLRPTYNSLKDYKKIIRSYTRKYKNRDVVVLNMMFHNVEVMKGLSPYSQTQAAADMLFGRIEDFLRYADAQGFESIGLSDLYPLYSPAK